MLGSVAQVEQLEAGTLLPLLTALAVLAQATKAAADIAGINVLCMINEPTAAALAFG